MSADTAELLQHGRVRVALVILLPATVLSVMLHQWAAMSPAAPVNADETMTRLKAFDILQGHPRRSSRATTTAGPWTRPPAALPSVTGGS